jgi:hypothetical protein
MHDNMTRDEWSQLLDQSEEKLCDLAMMVEAGTETEDEARDLMASLILQEAIDQGYTPTAVAKMLIRFQMHVGETMRQRAEAALLALNGVLLTTDEFQP